VVSAKQLVANNTFIRSGVGFATFYGGATTAGKFTDIEITGNKFLRTSSYGISIENHAADGISGEISGVIISGNYINGSPGAGVRLNGVVTEPSITCNTIQKTQWAVTASSWGANVPNDVHVNLNNFVNNTWGINNFAPTATNIDEIGRA